jgi:hypothetical protein
MSNAAASPAGRRLQDSHRGEPDRSHRRRRISRVSEHLQRQLDVILARSASTFVVQVLMVFIDSYFALCR